MLISLTLRVTGDQLDPDSVTAALGVSPHLCRRRGDIRLLRSGNEVISKFGLWEWQSKDESETLSIGEHLTRLQSVFGGRLSVLRGLHSVENAWIDIHVVDGDKSEVVSNVSLLFDPAALSILNGAGLPV